MEPTCTKCYSSGYHYKLLQIFVIHVVENDTHEKYSDFISLKQEVVYPLIILKYFQKTIQARCISNVEKPKIYTVLCKCDLLSGTG